MIKRIITLLIIGLVLLTGAQLHAQKDKAIGTDATRYKLGEISITGSETYNENTIIAFTGLKKGESLYIPGERLNKVIKKLWDLKLFSDISFYVTSIEGDVVNLELNIIEVPNLRAVTITGIKERKAKDLKKELKLTPGVKTNENLITNTRSFIENKYKKEGFINADATLRIKEVTDTLNDKKVDMRIDINKGNKVKITDITFNGNNELPASKLRGAMKNTKRKNFFSVFKRSKYVEEKFQEDLVSLVKKYKENGFRDARVVGDTLMHVNDERIALNISVEEGNKYYFGDIKFVGNSIYTDGQLRQKLGVEKGDVYNGVAFDERISNPMDPDADDIASMYQNNGYLFSNINTVETRVKNDTIDFEIRIIEGKEAYFKNITVNGNQRTNDHVVFRSIRTLPGDKYSKARIIRTIRELGQSGFFDAEKIDPQLKNVSEQDGTVDVQYNVTDTGGSSQIELQGGYGGGGFVGTLGLRFNNFSLRNIFNGESYKPLPTGDGQTLALRAQASTFFSTYSLNFVEPWLGGKKPVSFSTSLRYSEQFNSDPNNFRNVNRDEKFLITGITVGIAKQLRWPDDYFTLSQALSYQHYNLKNFNTSLFNFPNGYSNDLSYTIGLARDSKGNNLIYPTFGSEFSITAKLTLPYSLFNNVDYANLGDDPDYQTNGMTDLSKVDQEKYKFLEYYKIKFAGKWYTKIYEKLVLETGTEFGFLGAYNQDRGVVPFERFFVGGDGLGGYSLDGRDVVRLRGYKNRTLSSQDGDNIYNKFSLELRYPITLAQSASIYALTFAEAGGSYNGFDNYNPFDLYRSAGMGLRIFMPQFGLLGVDFGYGFDPSPATQANEPSGWNFHFILGQSF